ncbi:MAG: C69 family dipeptidase [Bacteroidales bacterium]|nr:C69 family dipeptidase [Bacteroidales bacterium]
MKKTSKLLAIGLITVLSAANFSVHACTNFMVTKGASADGSTMITYAADAAQLYGELYYRPAKTYPAGTMMTVYSWHERKNLGQIPQATQTYSVVGNMNEHQLAISETTFGGREELQDTTGIMDYGNLIYTTLQRAKTAREAIQVLHYLMSTYGYCKSGESFSIADKDEVWYMELIGKGVKIFDARGNVDHRRWTKGAVWVAMKVPDGYISGHANHARIMNFPIANPRARVVTSITCKDIARLTTTPSIEVVYAHDVITYAQGIGIFPANGKHDEFSFSDVYAPLDFGAMRFCEARVWSGFRKANRSGIMDQYEDYALGKNPNNRMPLWIKPDRKLSLQDVFDMMRDHYQGTPMDMTKDVGGGPFHSGYRWRPMLWELNGQSYIHERAISTQQTGFSFVTQSRSWLPNPIGGILWWGVDDTYTTVWAPMYCGMTEVPEVFKEGNGTIIEYSPTSAFWLFNLVANFAYSRYSDMIVDIQKVQRDLESDFMKKVAENDAAWKDETDHEKLVSEATRFSLMQGQRTFNEWKKLQEYLLVKYTDGNIRRETEINGRRQFETLDTAPDRTETPLQPRYPDWFYQQIVDQIGDNIKHIEYK